MMKQTGLLTFIQMFWNLSLTLINIPRLRFSHFVIDTINWYRAGNFKSASRDSKLLARLVPELYSTQPYHQLLID